MTKIRQYSDRLFYFAPSDSTAPCPLRVSVSRELVDDRRTAFGFGHLGHNGLLSAFRDLRIGGGKERAGDVEIEDE